MIKLYEFENLMAKEPKFIYNLILENFKHHAIEQITDNVRSNVKQTTLCFYEYLLNELYTPLRQLKCCLSVSKDDIKSYAVKIEQVIKLVAEQQQYYRISFFLDTTRTNEQGLRPTIEGIFNQSNQAKFTYPSFNILIIGPSDDEAHIDHIWTALEDLKEFNSMQAQADKIYQDKLATLEHDSNQEKARLYDLFARFYSGEENFDLLSLNIDEKEQFENLMKQIKAKTQENEKLKNQLNREYQAFVPMKFTFSKCNTFISKENIEDNTNNFGVLMSN